MIAYGIGGLGADERVFSKLKLDFQLSPLTWMPPKPKEPLEAYARRFLIQIDQTKPFVLIGVSFGGMLALETNKLVQVERVILISSAGRSSDVPILFRWIGKTGILGVLPIQLIKPPAWIANWLFGVNKRVYKNILKAIISDTDPHFLRWALDVILRWDNQIQPNNVVRIHGTADRLLGYSNNTILIQGGGHFMIMDKWREVSEVLNEEVQ